MYAQYPFSTACVGADCAKPIGPPAMNANACSRDTPYDGRCFRATVPPGPKSIPCKNGVPYDCNCNYIQTPYSMPFEANSCVTKCAPGDTGYQYLNPPFFIRKT